MELPRRQFLRLAAGASAIPALSRMARAQVVLPQSKTGTRLITLGTGGGPPPRAHQAQSSNLLTVNGTHYVIDAGDGVARRIAKAGINVRDIGIIFITHHHDDHTAGLGTLMSVAWDNQRTSPINVYGPPPVPSVMSRVPDLDCGSPACALAIRDRAGSAAAPAASCKKFRRRSFTPTLPRAVARGRLTALHHRFESFESQLMAHRRRYAAVQHCVRLLGCCGRVRGKPSRRSSLPLMTQLGHKARYSITSSARIKIDGGTARPSALAVLRFTAISNFVGI